MTLILLYFCTIPHSCVYVIPFFCTYIIPFSCVYVIPDLIGNPIGYIARWIPAFAGMT